MSHWMGHTKAGLRWDVYAGDALSVLQHLPEKSYNCVVTSPPYFWLRDYDVKDQIGQEETLEEYIDSIVCIMDEVFRVLKSDGLMFLNIGDTYYSGKGQSRGIDAKNNKRRFGLRAVDRSGGLGLGLQRKSIIGVPWRVAIALTQRGWILRSPIIWNRTHTLPESVKDRPRQTYEYIFVFAKDRFYYFNRDPLIEAGEEDIWTISARPKSTKGIKTAPYPDELVKRCLDVGCPPAGKVLDPFAGSGTTLRVALQTGREATGIDLNPKFCEYMVNTLHQLEPETHPLKKSRKKRVKQEPKCLTSYESISTTI